MRDYAVLHKVLSHFIPQASHAAFVAGCAEKYGIYVVLEGFRAPYLELEVLIRSRKW